MRYRVHITPGAEAGATGIYRWISDRAPAAADRWWFGLLDRVARLRSFPRRCPEAPEGGILGAPGRDVRQLVYGNYRILFAVEGRVVRILHVRHAARRRLDEEE